MQIPLQISFHGIERSGAIEDAVRKKAEKLERYYQRIISCRVVVELVGRHKRHGKQLVVHIDITVPGGEIAVTREHDTDVLVALREAFKAARRKLEDYARTQRGDVKRHPMERKGRVVRLDPGRGIGFIATWDGTEYYFSRENVVHPPFEELAVGTTVRFLEEVADEGLQAKRVHARRSALVPGSTRAF